MFEKRYFLSYLAQVISTLANFLMHLVIARVFGTSGSGQFFNAIMIANIGSVVGRFGMDNVVTRIAGASNNVKSLLDLEKKSVAFVGGVSIFVVLAILIWVIFGASLSSFVLVTVFAIPFMSVTSVYGSLLRGVGIAWPYQLVPLGGIALAVVVIMAGGLLISWVDGIEDVVVTYLLGAVIVFFATHRGWRKAYSLRCLEHSDVGTDKENIHWRDILQPARRLAVVSILNLAVFPWAPIYFLGQYSSISDVGGFGVASRLAAMLTLPMGVIVNLHAGALAQLSRKAGERTEVVRKMANEIAGAVCALALALFLLDENILELFGTDFVGFAPVLDVLVLGYLVQGLTGGSGMILMMAAHEKDVMNVLVFSSVLLLMLLFVFVDIAGLGALGAAMGVSVTIGVQYIILCFLVWRRLGIVALPGITRGGFP